MWDECNCVVVWAFFGIAFLWDWNENWPFPVLWPLLSFSLKNDRRIFIRFQGKAFTITVIQVHAPTTNAKGAEVERFYDDLQKLLELTPKNDVLFIIGDRNAKVGSQEIPGVTGKFGLGVQNGAEQRLTELRHKNTLVAANTLFQPQKRRLHLWPLLKLPNFLAYWVQHLNSIIF